MSIYSSQENFTQTSTQTLIQNTYAPSEVAVVAYTPLALRVIASV